MPRKEKSLKIHATFDQALKAILQAPRKPAKAAPKKGAPKKGK